MDAPIFLFKKYNLNLSFVKSAEVMYQVKSFLTGKEPRERLRELVLEEHVECGCQCKDQVCPNLGIIEVILLR